MKKNKPRWKNLDMWERLARRCKQNGCSEDTVEHIREHGKQRREKKMWYLAACDGTGKCIGFLKKDKTISSDPDSEMEKLMSFKRKKDTNEIVMQINLSYVLLKDGCEYRVTPVKC